MRTSEATLKLLRALRAGARHSVNIPVAVVDDVVEDLRDTHRRQRQIDEAVSRLEGTLTSKERSAE